MFATGSHDFTRRCTWISDCFWLDIFYPVAVEDMDPDIYVPHTFADYIAGRDPMLERVFQLEQARGR